MDEIKPKLIFKEIVRVTPGKLHAWVRVELPDGKEKIIKKEIKNIPNDKHESSEVGAQ